MLSNQNADHHKFYGLCNPICNDFVAEAVYSNSEKTAEPGTNPNENASTKAGRPTP